MPLGGVAAINKNYSLLLKIYFLLLLHCCCCPTNVLYFTLLFSSTGTSTGRPVRPPRGLDLRRPAEPDCGRLAVGLCS